MDTELNIQSFLLIGRALKHYKDFLNAEIENLRDADKDDADLTDQVERGRGHPSFGRADHWDIHDSVG